MRLSVFYWQQASAAALSLTLRKGGGGVGFSSLCGTGRTSGNCNALLGIGARNCSLQSTSALRFFSSISSSSGRGGEIEVSGGRGRGRNSKKIPGRAGSRAATAPDQGEDDQGGGEDDVLATFNKFNSVYLKSKALEEVKASKAAAFVSSGRDDLLIKVAESGRSPRKQDSYVSDLSDRQARERLAAEEGDTDINTSGEGRSGDSNSGGPIRSTKATKNSSKNESKQHNKGHGKSEDNREYNRDSRPDTFKSKTTRIYNKKSEEEQSYKYNRDSNTSFNRSDNTKSVKNESFRSNKKSSIKGNTMNGDMDFTPDVSTANQNKNRSSKIISDDINDNGDDDDIEVVVYKKGRPTPVRRDDVSLDATASKSAATNPSSKQRSVKSDDAKKGIDTRTYAEKRVELISKMRTDIDNKVLINTKTGGLQELDFIRKALKVDSKTSLNSLVVANKFRINRVFPEMSRNDVDQLLTKKQITINGVVAEKGSLVRTSDIVKVKGELVEWKDPSLKDSRFSVDSNRYRYIKMWKPRGVKSYTSDTQYDDENSNNVATLSGCIENLFRGQFHTVGALEIGYTGVVLLTNDSRVTNGMNEKMIPAKNSYEIVVRCPVIESQNSSNNDLNDDDYTEKETQSGSSMTITRKFKGVNNSDLKNLKSIFEKEFDFEGVSIQRCEKFASEIIVNQQDESNKPLKFKNMKLILYITEKGNQLPDIKRVFEKEDFKLVSIHRSSFAGISLSGLEDGHWKFLSDSEFEILEAFERKRKHLIKVDKKTGLSNPKRKLWGQLVASKGT